MSDLPQRLAVGGVIVAISALAVSCWAVTEVGLIGFCRRYSFNTRVLVFGDLGDNVINVIACQQQAKIA